MMSTIPRFHWRKAVPVRLVPLALLFSLLISLSFHSSTFAASQQTIAPDGPGALSYFDLARKDCVGTARNTSSKVWFTLADGVLSDVYYPTIDNTNVKTLQYVVTDGSTFTDLQTRDTTYTVQLLDKHALDCRVTTTAKSGKYSIVTDYLTDPGRNAVAMHVSFKPLIGTLLITNCMYVMMRQSTAMVVVVVAMGEQIRRLRILLADIPFRLLMTRIRRRMLSIVPTPCLFIAHLLPHHLFCR